MKFVKHGSQIINLRNIISLSLEEDSLVFQVENRTHGGNLLFHRNPEKEFFFEILEMIFYAFYRFLKDDKMLLDLDEEEKFAEKIASNLTRKVK